MRKITLLILLMLVIISTSVNAKQLKEENDMLAAADVNEGQRGMSTCLACHTLKKGEPNKVGPNLFGIVGAKKGRKKNYDYSPAYKEKAKEKGHGVWTVDELSEWLRDPADYAPGTKMSFPGILDPQDRMDVIAYLMTLK
jgi:cytochrome c